MIQRLLAVRGGRLWGQGPGLGFKKEPLSPRRSRLSPPGAGQREGLGGHRAVPQPPTYFPHPSGEKKKNNNKSL